MLESKPEPIKQVKKKIKEIYIQKFKININKKYVIDEKHLIHIF